MKQERSNSRPVYTGRSVILRALPTMLALIACGDGTAGPPDAGQALPADLRIGVTMPDLVWASLGLPPTNVTTRAQMKGYLANARAAGFTHVRFAGTPSYPSQMTSPRAGWMANPAAYWAAYDTALADARAAGLRVVPIIFWEVHLFPDVAQEPVGALFTPGSKTRLLAERYVTELVTRYKDKDFILFWELGGELHLWADEDFSNCDVCDGSAPMTCGAVVPSLGTPCKRTAADEFYTCNSCRGVSAEQQDLGQFSAAMAALIRGIDPGRSISSGSAYLRPYAAHLAAAPAPNGDGTADTEAQYRAALANLHPPGVDIISVHHLVGLGADEDNARFGSSDLLGLDLLARTQAAAVALGKTLFVGEITQNRPGSVTCEGQTTVCGGDPTRAGIQAVLDALVAQDVRSAALWAWQDHLFCAGTPECFGLEPGDEVTLKTAEHNAAFDVCVGKGDGSSCPIGNCSAGRCIAPSPASRASALARWPLHASGDLSGWMTSTTCSGCSPGTLSIVGGHAQLASDDLACTSCGQPGVYAFSPAVTVADPYVTLRFSAFSSASDTLISLVVMNDVGQVILQRDAAVDNATSVGRNGLTLHLPPAAAKVQVQLRLRSAHSTLDVDEVDLDSQ